MGLEKWPCRANMGSIFGGEEKKGKDNSDVINMGNKMTPYQNELYHATDEVLHYMWDPIGIAGEPGARDEYHSYLPRIFKMVLDGNLDVAAKFMDMTVSETMGLTNNPTHNRKIVDILHNWKVSLLDKYQSNGA